MSTNYSIAEGLSRSEQRKHKRNLDKQMQESEMWERRFPSKRTNSRSSQERGVERLTRALFGGLK